MASSSPGMLGDEKVDVDVESYWKDLPRGTKEYVEKSSTEVVLFFVGINSYFTLDDYYHWDLPKSLKATYIIAADYLIKGNNEKAIQMIFYGALIREYLARGFWTVRNILGTTQINLANRLVREGSKKVHHVEPKSPLLFSMFNFLHTAVAITKSRKTMAACLYVRLASYPDAKSLLRHMRVTIGKFGSKPVLHSIDTFGATPMEIMTMKITFAAAPNIEMFVYGDTVSNQLSLNIPHSIVISY